MSFFAPCLHCQMVVSYKWLTYQATFTRKHIYVIWFTYLKITEWFFMNIALKMSSTKNAALLISYHMSSIITAYELILLLYSIVCSAGIDILLTKVFQITKLTNVTIYRTDRRFRVIL